jgi:hypothetical protein
MVRRLAVGGGGSLMNFLENGGSAWLILGAGSGELVNIDLDCPEALAIADLYLPVTEAEFGRTSKRRSHRLYVAAGAAFEAFADPIREGKNTLLARISHTAASFRR